MASPARDDEWSWQRRRVAAARGRVSALASLLAFMCAHSVEGIRAGDADPFVVGVRLIARPVLSDRIAAGLRSESESLWRPYGVHLEWTEGDPEGMAPAFSLDAIVDGWIRDSATTKWAVLGRAIINHDASGAMPIHLSFEATERVLALRMSTPASRIQIVHEREMGRALGRVLAHEIGHVLLGEPGHDDTGLMRPAFRPHELADENRAPFRLTCDTVGRVTDRIRMLTGDPPGVSDRHTCISLDGS